MPQASHNSNPWPLPQSALSGLFGSGRPNAGPKPLHSAEWGTDPAETGPEQSTRTASRRRPSGSEGEMPGMMHQGSFMMSKYIYQHQNTEKSYSSPSSSSYKNQ
ncbi:hypothetical protein TgHK011_001623 [Trichoderma gracile]|nr:hypothetical protein TgHK011_001623 [Trichoderma gracile]